jgi:hypothetical protein
MAAPEEGIGKSKETGDKDLKNLQAKSSENMSNEVQDLMKGEKLAERKADQPSTKELDDKEKSVLVAIKEVATKHGSALENTNVASVVNSGAAALESGDKGQLQKAREQHKQVVIGLKAYQDAGGKFHDAELEQMVKNATA